MSPASAVSSSGNLTLLLASGLAGINQGSPQRGISAWLNFGNGMVQPCSGHAIKLTAAMDANVACTSLESLPLVHRLLSDPNW
jgi:hypothetical protein